MTNWFHVHPLTGVTRTNPPSAHVVGVTAEWHSEGEAAQDETDDRFLAAMIEYFAAPEATFEADLPLPEDQERLRTAAARAGIPLETPHLGVFVGRLDGALGDAFPASPLILSVRHGDAERLHIHDDMRETYVCLHENEAQELTSFLQQRALLI